jgi:hypothetical protein
MATELFSDDFETGDVSLWDSETDVSNDLDVHADGAYAGSFGLRFFNDGVPPAYVEKGWAGEDQVYVTFRLKLPLLAVIPNLTFLRFVFPPAGGADFDIFIRKSGAAMQTLYVIGGTTSGGGAYQVIPGYLNDASFQLIEIFGRNTNLASPTAWLRWNGNLVESITPISATAFSGMRIGDTSGTNWSEFEYIDNIEAWDDEVAPGTAFLPPAADTGVALGRTASAIQSDQTTAASIAAGATTAASIAAQEDTAASDDFPTAGG